MNEMRTCAHICGDSIDFIESPDGKIEVIKLLASYVSKRIVVARYVHIFCYCTRNPNQHVGIIQPKPTGGMTNRPIRNHHCDAKELHVKNVIENT